jgi:hypothetical protein
MDNTQLQIVITAVNEAEAALETVSDQLSGIATTAQEAGASLSADMQSSLSTTEEAAATAAEAAAASWGEFEETVTADLATAATAATGDFEGMSSAGLAAAEATSTAWHESIASLNSDMAAADAQIVEAATELGEEAGTAAGEGFGSYFKSMIIGYALDQIGSFFSGGIESAIASVSQSSDKISTLNAQIQQQKADIQVNEAAMQKWVGTTAEVNAAHQKAAANIDAEKVKITELTQQLGPLMQAQGGLPGQIQGIADATLEWIGAHKQLEDTLQTFLTTLGPILQSIGELLIVITVAKVAFSALSTPMLILIAIGVTIALLTAIWQTFHTQIIAFLNDLDTKTGIITTFKDAWHSVVTEYDENLKPALENLWTALQPLMPYIKELAEVALFLMVKEIQIAVPIIVGLINAFTELLTMVTQIETFFTNKFVEAINAVGTALNAVFNSAAFKAVSGLVGGAVSGISSAISSVTHVQDAIITPGGGVIQTDVADYLIATKNPGALVGAGAGGGGITVNILGGYYLDQNAAQQIGNALATSIGRQLKLKNYI